MMQASTDSNLAFIRYRTCTQLQPDGDSNPGNPDYPSSSSTSKSRPIKKMYLLDKKSFLFGISLVSFLYVAWLLVHMTAVYYAGSARGHSPSLPQPKTSSRSGHLPKMIQKPDSRLGIYRQAAVVTDGVHCAEIGTNVLRQNGTAVDAAIASLFCNGAVHSHSMGIGGGFIMTIYIEKEQKAYSLMARETAPKAATETMFVDNAAASQKGALAAGIPGELMGYGEAKMRFGNPDVSFASLVEPTIRLCEEGLPVTKSLLKSIRFIEDHVRNNTEFRDLFINPNTEDLLKIGDTYRRPVLAQTLRRIAQNGPQEFYTGKVGKDLVKDLKEEGGIITEEDLANYRVRWEEPVNATLANGMMIFSSPPPASGAITIGILNTLAHFNLQREDASDPKSYHRFIEACKYGFAKRTYLGDWADGTRRQEIQELVDSLTSPEWGRSTSLKIRDDWTSNDSHYYGADFFSSVEDAGTTHISILAPNGDAVAVTSTINTYFGSGLISKSTGILLNNNMDDFSTPGSINFFGVYPSESNLIKPGRRPVTSMTPTIIVSEEGKVKMVIGASGGPKIITGTTYTAMNKLWFGKNIKEAIDFPRVHHQLMPMEVTVEYEVDQAISDYLESTGHKINYLKEGEVMNSVQAIAVEAEGIVTGNPDRRKGGQVDGF